MTYFSESDALERLQEIGQAFENDYNDGDSGVAYESMEINDLGDPPIMTYKATLEDGSNVEFKWILERYK